MTKALNIVLAIGVAVGLLWTFVAAMAHGAGGLGAIAVFLIIYPIFAVFFLFAAWVFWKHPDERTRAGWIMLLPVVFWFLPLAIRSMAGGYLASQQLTAVLLMIGIVAIAGCWFAPKNAAVFVPKFLARSRVFNWLLIFAVVAGWLLFVGIIVYVVNEDIQRSADLGTTLAYALFFAATYLVLQGVASFLVSTWAWLCLRGEFEGAASKLNITQIVVSAPGVLIAVAIAVWMSAQGQL